MKILINDGLRYANASGYGMLSRAITRQLHKRGHKVLRQEGPKIWGKIERGAREFIESLAVARHPSEADVVLQIGPPNVAKSFPRPTLLYTQNALGGLRSDWARMIQKVDGVIVPSEQDRRVFSRHHERVYIAQQSSDPRIFQPRRRWRVEGPDHFTFLFVGSYSWRKGVDLLLEAFLTEFSPDEPVELWMHTPKSGPTVHINHLLSYLRRHTVHANLRFSDGILSPEWMCRLYNRVDCLVTLSRGEGWCMPITEALLCGLPVIAPASTAMGEYLSEEVAYLIPTQEHDVQRIEGEFGAGFMRAYAEGQISYWEPDLAAARERMREVYQQPAEARCRAERGRVLISRHVTWEMAGERIEGACRDVLERQPIPKPVARGCLPEEKARRLPNLVIIGAHKCGTTALHRYLSLHPEIAMSSTKELHFFVEEVNWGRGIDWYLRWFPSDPPAVVGEASPSYTNFPTYQRVPEKMRALLPDAKLIFMVRDPVERIVSHYRMERARGPNPRSFEDTVLRAPNSPYVAQSMYWMQLEQFLRHYPREAVLVLRQEDLLEDPKRTLGACFGFLGVDNAPIEGPHAERVNTSDEREIAKFGERLGAPEITVDERARLIGLIAADIERFRTETGIAGGGWCV